ncbi:hypothetical protein GNI_012090 [Gregarina niphandrodes]|uniref:Uncharacterized protein n=1 Tax=Gregarina niphandrodes TaxID=110365 RepID=A0A023BCL1_GRENI|nr:hypothetical protein GNI_012090 [Gregarina niphandrodes]EZG85049.1 hypothetical protein GNI_012090 [Gregarina niphandrodes]|eukprot:XP_011128842.1 hypothetical protein GNI_012090 [Gregarina niphandrodes]
MRICRGGRQNHWITMAVFGVPNEGRIPPEDSKRSNPGRPEAGAAGPPRPQVFREPLLEATTQTWSVPREQASWEQAPVVQPLSRAWLAAVQPPQEPWNPACFPMTQATRQSDSPQLVGPTMQMSEQPGTSGQAWFRVAQDQIVDQVVGPLKRVSFPSIPALLIRPLSRAWFSQTRVPFDPLMKPLTETVPDPQLEVSRKPLVDPPKKAPGGPVVEAPQEQMIENPQEPVTKAYPEPLVGPWLGSDLVGRVLEECLATEQNLKPTLCAGQETDIVRLATASILREIKDRGCEVPISDFEACSWRWLNLALLIHEWEVKNGSVRKVVAEIERLIPKPVGYSDTWFLAGMLHRFLSSGCLARWLPNHHSYGWNCRKLIFRVTFPDGVVRLPESEECVNRICASSKLAWWLCEAQRNIQIDEETWKVSKWPTKLFNVQTPLGKRVFEKAIEAMRQVIPPPSGMKLSNSMYLACLLKYVDRVSQKQRKIKGYPKITIDPTSDRPSSSIPPHCKPSCSSPFLVECDDTINPDRSVAAEMGSFMASVLEGCKEREKMEVGDLTRTQKKSVARYARRKYRAVLSQKSKSIKDPNLIANAFRTCGWRWLCLVGLMNEYLDPGELHQLIADSEKIVPRPKHVSPLWYLACRMQNCVKGSRIIPGFGKSLDALPAWWVLNMIIYQDHFPQEFGELPMSETSTRLIVFSSRATHWLASGIRHFRLTSATWSPTSNHDIVDIFHTVLGDQWFNEMINLIKPKISQIAPNEGPQQMQRLSPKSIMETVLRYAMVSRKASEAFCTAWQFDVPSKKYGLMNSEADEEPTAKRLCSG